MQTRAIACLLTADIVMHVKWDIAVIAVVNLLVFTTLNSFSSGEVVNAHGDLYTCEDLEKEGGGWRDGPASEALAL